MVEFNPDVQPAQEPISTDVTRPISRPEANKAKGTLFEGAGKGLSETGQIITDATKLQDFTNKEWLSNAITDEASQLRDRRYETELEKNVALNQTSAQMPVGVASSINSKIDKLKAMADQTQQDAGYRARVAQLAKEYRSAYPQFRGYIDQQFEKAGFGNPANEALSSLERANQKIQATLSVGNDKLINEIYTHLDKTGARGSQMIQELQQGGDPNRIREEFSRILNNGYRVEQRQKQFTLAKAQGENVEETSARTVTQNALTDTATYMHDPQVQKDINYLDQVSKTGGGDTRELQNIYNRMSMGLVNLKAKARDRDSTPRDEISLDEYGNEISTGRKISHTSVLKEKYAKAADEGFAALGDMVARLGQSDYGLIKNTANMVKATEDEATKYLFNHEAFGQAAQAMSAFRRVAPEWLTSLVQTGLLTGKIPGTNTTFSKEMEGFITGINLNAAGGSAPVYDVLKNVPSNPAVKKALVEFGPKTLARPDTPKEAAENIVMSHLGIKNDEMMNQLKPSDHLNYYRMATDPSTVQNISKLDPQHIGVYSEWVRSQFSKGVVDSLNMLPSIAAKYKVSWDDKTHQFDVKYPEDRPFQRAEHYTKGQNVDIVKDRINGYLKGLSNYAAGAGLDVNAFLINEMKSSGLRNNKFWDALKAQSSAYVTKKAEQ